MEISPSGRALTIADIVEKFLNIGIWVLAQLLHDIVNTAASDIVNKCCPNIAFECLADIGAVRA